MTLLLLTFTEKSQTLTVPKNLLIEHASKYDFSSYSHQSNRYVDPFVQNNLFENSLVQNEKESEILIPTGKKQKNNT